MHPVTQLVLDRKKSNSKPNDRKDGFKLGLAIEGGGMRGVVSAGMVAALEQLGLRDVFDCVYGSSAGSINGAYFISRQAVYGTTIYYENINNNHFADLRYLPLNLLQAYYPKLCKPFNIRPVVSLDYLLFDVSIRQKILDTEAVMNSDIPLHVYTYDVDNEKPVCFNSARSSEELLTQFKAGALMPFVGGTPVEIDGTRYIDASVATSIPYREALADGCTHVLALCTRPKGILRGVITKFEKMMLCKYLSELSPNLCEQYFEERPARYKSIVENLERMTNEPSESDNGYAYRVAPAGANGLKIGNVSKTRQKLVSGAREGYQAILDLFSETPGVAFEGLVTLNGNGNLA